MDPITMASVGMGASAGGAGLGALSSIMGGEAKAGEYGYKAAVADLNAKIATRNAEQARESGELEARQIGLAGGQRYAGILTAKGTSNIDVASGSATQVLDSQRQVTREDETMKRTVTAQKAYGFDVQAEESAAEARMARAGAENAKTAGMLGALGSVIGGVSSVSDKWLKAKNVGIFPSGGGGGYNPVPGGGW